MTIFPILLRLFLAVWITFETWLVIRDQIQHRGKTQRDRGSRYFMLLAIIVGVGTAAVVNRNEKFFFGNGSTNGLSWAGLVLMLLGFSLRIWAIQLLGKSFRTTVETHQDQQVCQDGPYKLLRHPSYTGIVLICIGFGIAVQNWLSLLLAVIPSLIALLFRIQVEEKELAASLGSEYVAYQQHTKRLIPWIW
jgi:protein-S-isoprenylcysteine O-methyltransferase Ste14